MGKKAHSDIVGFLENEMGYESFILEKDSGLCASSIFYKKDKFKCLETGHINLDFRMINPNEACTVGKD